MALAEVSIVPVGINQPSFSSYVVRAAKIAENNGVDYRVTPLGTVLQGNVSQVLAVAQMMHQAALDEGAERVVTNIQIDERRDAAQSIEQSVQKVQQQIQ